MRDYASAQQEYNDLLLRFNELQRGFDILQNSVDNGAGVGAIAANVLDLRQRTEVNLAFVQTLQDLTIPDINDASQNQVEALYNATGALRDRYNDLLDSTFDLTRQAAKNDKERDLLDTQPKNSAGDIVNEEKAAEKEDAKTQSPSEGAVVFNQAGRVVSAPDNANKGTNAKLPETIDDTGIEALDVEVDYGTSAGLGTVGAGQTTVTTQQSQIGSQGQTAATAAHEDAYTPPQSTTGTTTVKKDGRPDVAKEYTDPIVPTDNLLSTLSSMTYTTSLYLMSPSEYADLVLSQDKKLTTKQLLISGGGATEAERNPWFNVDFYIEDLELESVVGTQAAGAPHNVTTLQFKVVEPNGITFLNRLNNAVIDHITGNEEDNNAMAQSYLLIIRFYGNDAAGNQVNAASLQLPATSDHNAIMEKFIPFTITGFSYKISTRLTEYSIKGAAIGSNIAFSTQRGVVPFNLQLSASNVNQLFNGNKVLANGGGESGSTETVVSGLMDAINQHQRKLATPDPKTGKQAYAIPDEYAVVFQNEDIKNSKVLQPGNANKGRAVNQTAAQAAKKYLDNKLNYDPKSKSYNVLAGTQIAQLIDLTLRTSSFVTSQQNIIIDEKTGEVKRQPNSKPMLWYRIKTKMEPKGYDKLRKTVAYKITYLVSEYQINTPRSPYFPNSQYYGTHKLYNYWFTGLNTEVLDFEIDVNSNYFMVIGNDGERDNSSQGQFAYQQSFSSAPGQSLQSGSRNSTVPAANLSDRLYHYADVASTELQIVGDPDWIQQSELIYNSSITTETYCPDGSLNYDSREVLFELRFNPAQDYDLKTGLTNVYENNRDIEATGELSVAQESMVWQATTVTSTFSQGQFTQRLKGVMRNFASSIDPDSDDKVISPTTGQQVTNKLNDKVQAPTKEDPVIDEQTSWFSTTSQDDDAGIALSP